MEVRGLLQTPAALPPGKNPGTHWKIDRFHIRSEWLRRRENLFHNASGDSLACATPCNMGGKHPRLGRNRCPHLQGRRTSARMGPAYMCRVTGDVVTRKCRREGGRGRKTCYSETTAPLTTLHTRCPIDIEIYATDGTQT